ncbi:MAG: hypothetical protein J0H51_20050, partial [Rhizobiales bacterium]|nr:hypothetical protein [Hyphomicrobiales bacterium]
MQKMLLDLAKSLQGAAYKPAPAKFKAAVAASLPEALHPAWLTAGLRHGAIFRRTVTDRDISIMALALFRKRTPATVDVDEPAASAPLVPGAESVHDPAKDILSLLELELGAMIRQLEHAAASVAGGADGTAATLQSIRQRTDALTGRAGTATQTAATFTEAADRFTRSADGINHQVREASRLADQAGAAAADAGANV